MSGFSAIRREAFERVKPCLSPEGFKIMLELVFLLSQTGRDKILEYPITFAMHKQGERKLSGCIIVQYLAMLIHFFKTKKAIRQQLVTHA